MRRDSHADAVHVLRSASTVRERCHAIAAAVEAGASSHFTLDMGKLDAVAQRIAALTRDRFPDLKIPYHSRWRHFESGGVDRKGEMDAALLARRVSDPAAVARARIDLTVVSVLLDAGAGPGWRFVEDGQTYARSEGLGVASFRAFMQGRFSSDPAEPLRVDADALSTIDAGGLAAIFQVDDANPLVGLDGRAQLLRRLGSTLAAQPAVFGVYGRPGALFGHLAGSGGGTVQAADLLRALLDTLSPIWPSGQVLARSPRRAPGDEAPGHVVLEKPAGQAPGEGTPVGDVWPHPHAGGSGPSAGLVPFHKLSQWMSYSLLEPFEWAGVTVGGLDALTGLPEYRNGGLLIDAGVIVPRDAAFADILRTPADPWVVEWRALTVALLDRLAPRVRDALGVTADQLPLACILEGGSWAAGRQIAAELRDGGPPPVRIDSDGTLF